MKISKIKYSIAVAVILIATAFCGCGAKDEEVILLETPEEKILTEEDNTDKMIKVYVCGAVRKPDVYTIEADVRMIDAVNEAGGFCDDAGVKYLNLAAPVKDGQKIYIPTEKEIEDALASSDEIYGSEVNITHNSPGLTAIDGQDAQISEDSGSEGTSGLVDINHADRQTLMTLPGIGQSKADKIIAYREANGGFSSIEDIMLVGGIKEGMFNKIRDSICVR